jgi:hypothetical protein
MQKQILFGRDKASIVNDNIKNKVIDYLYSVIDLSKYRYIILNTIQKLNFLKETEHLVSPNYKGYNYLLIMILIDNIKYSVVLDRRKLSYHKNQIDMTNLNIIKLNMNVNIDDSFYTGTIFNGKLVTNTTSQTFFLQDCFYLMGKEYLNIPLNIKLNEMEKICSNFTTNYCKNFDIKVNKIYYYDELDNLINNIIPESTLPVNGLIFYPNLSGINILFIDNKADTSSVSQKDNLQSNSLHSNQSNNLHSNNLQSKNSNKIHLIENNLQSSNLQNSKYEQTIINDYVLNLKNRTYSYEIEGIKRNMWLTKTDIPDVFNIYEKEYGDKLGIALIPNLKISYLCASTITDKPTKFKCIYNDRFKKWIPLEMA